MVDHYRALGIRRTATQGEVRAAYLHWAKLLHPDVNSEPDAAERFVRVKDAYDILGQPETRSNYDATLTYYERTVRQREEASSQSERMKFYQAQQEAEAERAAKKAEEEKKKPKPDRGKLLDHLKYSRLKDAEELALQLLDLNGRDAMAWAALGDIAKSRGELEAAHKHYAYAAQFDPGNPAYIQQHIDLTQQLKSPKAGVTRQEQETALESEGSPVALGGFAALVIVLCCWIVMDRTPLPVGFGPIATWSISLGSSLAIAGLALGFSLSFGHHIDPIFLSGPSALVKRPPALTIGALAVASFWVMAVVYLILGLTQNAFNRSLSWVVSGCAGTLAVLSAASLFVSPSMAASAFIWGGVIVYSGSLIGWAFADAFKPSRVR